MRWFVRWKAQGGPGGRSESDIAMPSVPMDGAASITGGRDPRGRPTPKPASIAWRGLPSMAPPSRSARHLVCLDRSVAASVVWRRRGVVAIIRRRRVEVGAPRMRAMPAPVRAPPSVMPTTMPPAVPTISLPLSAVGITPALGLGGGGVKSRSRGEGDEHRTHQNAAYPSHGSILRPLATAGIAAPGPPSTSS